MESGSYDVALERVKGEMKRHIGDEREELRPTAVKRMVLSLLLTVAYDTSNHVHSLH